MKNILECFKGIPQYHGISSLIKDKNYPIGINGIVDSAKSVFINSLFDETKHNALILTHSRVKAKKMYEELQEILGDDVIYIPTREIILYNIEAKSHMDDIQRVKSMHRLINNDYKIAIAPVEAMCVRVTNKEVFTKNIIKFEKDKEYDFDSISKLLINCGYEKCELVESYGQYSIRGDIVDVFSPSSKNPTRIEFFGDTIDLIREFDVDTQRSIDELDSVIVLPCNEQIINEEEIQIIINKIENESISKDIKEDLENLKSNTFTLPQDKYFSLIDSSMSMFSYLNSNTIIVLDNDERCIGKTVNYHREYGLICEKLLTNEKLLPSCTNMVMDFFESLGKREVGIIFPDVTGYNENYSPDKEFSILTRDITAYRGSMKLLLEDISKWKSNGKKIVLYSPTQKSSEMLSEFFHEQNIDAIVDTSDDKELVKGKVYIFTKGLSEGFEVLEANLCVIGSKKIFRKSEREIKKKKRTRNLDLFATLKVGDFVVHDVHGIGKYVGIEKIKSSGIEKDYLKVLYKNDDSVYIPINKMELIQKYIGGEGRRPKLSKLGGVEWERTKTKVKASVKDIAKELTELYAKRKSVKGFKYQKDNIWQMSFEDDFIYQETPDQLRCIDEIKNDMESDIVMDRLLCGDVGYGKTEVAIRAAFKACMDSKQVAILVPTTVLAYQHYNTFIKRIAEYPINVDYMCRFRSKEEQKKTIEKLKDGRVDIVIGTHRLLSKDIDFKDLGLLVIDEEQRFGVEHKEKIKNYKSNVDVLSLSATPIPRTLHMSLSGIRDISLIEDPPAKRFPVQTYVIEYDYEIIKDAIDREIARNGQVFYLYNRVKDMDIKYSKLVSILGDDIRIAMAHGQMNEHKLESVMKGFINKEYDVLLCSTIIESGLDIPNANTIIIEDANRMGLAQLYQIRGRVGRTDKVAYAYITHQRGKRITEDASKRLEAIKEFTEFGSGFKIAMKDLEIRGAGNVLGANQHGHLGQVGYDMYVRLLNVAIKNIDNNMLKEVNKEECSVEINLNAFIASKYISNDLQRMDIYKRIAIISNEQEKIELVDELLDRYGEVPKEIINIIDVAIIKHLGEKCGFSGIIQLDRGAKFVYNSKATPDLNAISMIGKEFKEKILLKAGATMYILAYTDDKGVKLIRFIKRTLEKLCEYAN